MKFNQIKDRRIKDESIWVEKWNVFGKKPNRVYYRLFSNYIDDDKERLNIVPEDICHEFIESVLNPYKFRPFYADKNMFDKILPPKSCPKTILRRIQGQYYTADYKLIDSLSDNELISLLEECTTKKIIIKPSFDSCSGNGVKLFAKQNSVWIEYNIESYIIWLFQFCGMSCLGCYTDEKLTIVKKDIERLNIR